MLNFQHDDSRIRTAAEVAVGVTPVNYAYQPGEVLRQGANTTPGTTDIAAHIQAAIDAADDIHAEVYLRDDNGLGKPLLIRASSPTTQQNIALVGNGRVSTILRPLSNDIKQSPQNYNALIINQLNNTHLHLTHLRCLDNSVYTGEFLYCKEGGTADGSAQALFSAVIDDCWFGFSSNNVGICHGGFSNLRVSKCVFESSKTGCFILEGAGNSDQQYIGNVMNECYDAFIYGGLDTLTKSMIIVDVLTAYQHFRGPLIEVKNTVESIFENIILEANVANVGSTGLFKFTDCTDILCTNFLATTASGVPKCATGIEIVNGFKGKFQAGKIAATTGVKFSGTGTLDVTFENVDFIGCDNAVDWVSGTLSGKIIFRNCRFNDNQAFGLIVSGAGTHSWDLTLIDCEVMNAGLRGAATDRNFDFNTSGKVRLIRCKFGQDNASAAATHYIRAEGSGTFEVIDPIIVGTPPTALKTGVQTVTYDGVDSSMPGMPALTPSLGGTATYTNQQAQWNIKNKRCNFSMRLTVNTIGTGSTLNIDGLPFTSHGTYYGGVFVNFFSGAANSFTWLTGFIAPGTTQIQMRDLTAAATGTTNTAVFANGTDVVMQGSYPLP